MERLKESKKERRVGEEDKGEKEFVEWIWK